MKRYRRHAGVLLAGLVLGGAGDPADPVSRMQDPRWADHVAQAREQLRHGPFDTVLLGDSIMQEVDKPGDAAWNNFAVVWQRWFACHRPIDLGFAGDTTANLLWRMQNGLLPDAAPKLAVVLIGTNNQRPGLGWSAPQTAQAIWAIVDGVHRRFAPTHIVVLAIPPNGHGARVNATIDAVNEALAKRDWAAEHAQFAPTGDLFKHDGMLDPSLFREPHFGRSALHPDAHGWERMAARIMTLAAPGLGWAAGPCKGAPAAP